jgi:hypothetical protein
VARLAAEAPAAPPGHAVLAPGDSTPTKVAAQLGDDYDESVSPPATPAPGEKHGLAAALDRIESLWIKDMFTALQILRVNGSAKARSRAPYQWLVSNLASGAPRTRLVLKAMSAPATVVEADFAGLYDDQVTEVRAFLDLRSWDDPVAGLARKGAPGAGTLTDRQRDLVEYIRRRRAVATAMAGTVASGPGLQYVGRPAADPTPTGAAAGSLDAEIWRELDAEGSASSINTYDDQVLTWGKGWSALSTLPGIVDAFFAADPGARDELMEAGFTHRAAEGKWLFVDVGHGWVLEGNEALQAFRADRRFVGLLAHVAEDPAHQQGMVDAQAQALRTGGRAGDVPADIRAAWPATWSTNAVRFGAHCVHWGRTWGEVRAHGPAIHDLLRWISDIKGHVDANQAVVVRGWSSHTIRGFGNRAGEHLMTAAAPLPSPTVAGTYYFQDEGASPNYWSWRP